MAHKLSLDDGENLKVKTILPSFSGKYGFALLIRGKQLFFGFQLDDVEIEKVVIRKSVKLAKGRVKVLRYDPIP